MLKNLLIAITLVLLMPLWSNAEGHDEVFHVITIGNLADLDPDSKEFDAVIQLIDRSDETTVILFSGDITKTDLTDPVNRTMDSLRLLTIVQSLQKPNVYKIIFIPGDRDWSHSGKSGWENVSILEEMLESLPFDNLKWSPGHGCPGPKELDVGEYLKVVTINTQYWNHHWDKPSPTDAICKISSKEEFMEELEDILGESGNKNILITGHFPVISGGEYGGRMAFKKHIFPLTDVKPGLWIPLPVVGSFYPAYRQNIGSSMDIINAEYDEFNSALKNIFQDHGGIIYVSGHDYIQQLIHSNGSYILNSGSLSKGSFSGPMKENLYASNQQGVSRLEYQQNGNVNVSIYILEDSKLQVVEHMTLYQSSCIDAIAEKPVNEFYAPCFTDQELSREMSEKYGQTTVIAGEEYSASKFKTLFLGKHYRDAWTQAITLNYLDLDSTFGGLTPIKRGGGRQTTSLKFRAGNGCEYVFRSVNKDPKKALSYNLRETIVADVVKDQTTTQHPYGAMATTIMLDELGILHPHPVLYVLPPDQKLGPFREEYSNLLGMLEESPKSPALGCPGFGGSDEVLRSYKLFRKLYKDHDHRVDQQEFAKAKVFDIFVGDWGRHEDNWKWAAYENDKLTVYEPIPRDRDHVFSVWDGLLPWLADREWAKTSGDHFGYRVKDIRSLTWSARHLDRVVLTNVSQNDWLEQSSFVKEHMTDQVIEQAIRNMPPEVYDCSGKEIESKLKSRRENLDEFVRDYYLLLAKYVDVLGTAKKEIFRVSRLEDRSVNVKVLNSKENKLLFDRTFYPKETREIRLYGLGNEDAFYLSGESDKSILVRVVGGEDQDKIVDESAVKGFRKKTMIYERDPGSIIEAGTEAKTVNSWNEDLYRYDRHAFAYNTYFPLPFIGYNADDGLMLGLGVTFTRQKFGKKDFSSKHRLDLKGSTSGNLQFSYDAQLHHVIHKWDVIYYGLLAYPTDFVSFFGYGNESVKSDSLYSANYYKTRYNSIQVGGGVLRDFLRRSQFSLLINYENNDGQISENTILDQPVEILGTEKVNLYELTAILDLDFRNDNKFPEKGMRLFTEFNQGLITNNSNSSYSKFLAFMEFHSTIRTILPIFIGLRGGGALSSGDLPFYKLNNLGQNNYLQGYRKNRFTGRSMVFFNSDLKVQILDIATRFVPIKFGVRGFYDIGRVFIDGEESNKLHSGYGAGIYFIPLENNFSLSLNMAFSEEEKKGLIIFEFGISF